MRGKKNPPSTHPPPCLPPCKVCGQQATGFHYGVNVCVACKGFFRRSFHQEEQYSCVTGLNTCVLGPNTDRRKSCPKCRLDKCYAVGMSKNAIKTGRYSFEKKSRDIFEVICSKEAAEGSQKQQPELSSTRSSTSPVNSPARTTTDRAETCVGDSEQALDNSSQGITINRETSKITETPSPRRTDSKVSTLSEGNDSVQTLKRLPEFQYTTIFSPTVSFTKVKDSLKRALKRKLTSCSKQEETSECQKDDYIISDQFPTRQMEIDHLRHESLEVRKTMPHRMDTSFENDNTDFLSTDESLSSASPGSFSYITDTFSILNQDTPPRSVHSLASAESHIQPTDHFGTNSESEFLPQETHQNNGARSEMLEEQMPLSEYYGIAGSARNSVRPYSSSSSHQHCYPNTEALNSPYISQHPFLSSEQCSETLQLDFQTVCESNRDRNPNKQSELSRTASGKELDRVQSRCPEVNPFVLDPSLMQIYLEEFVSCGLLAVELELLRPVIKEYCGKDLKYYQPPGKVALTQWPSRNHERQCEKHLVLSPVSWGEFSEKELDMTMAALIKGHHNTIGKDMNSWTQTEIENKLETFMKIRSVKERVFGKIGVCDNATYFRVLETTGVYVDGRKRYMEYLVKVFEHSMRDKVKFYKSIVGFKDLCMEDKVFLTKHSFTLIQFLGAFRGISRHRGMGVDDHSSALDYNFIRDMYYKEMDVQGLMSRMYEITDILIELNFSVEELILLKSIVATMPDREQLVEFAKVDRIQQRLRCCLLLTMSRTRPNPLEIFSRVHTLLDKMRSLVVFGKMLFSTPTFRKDFSRMISNVEAPLVSELAYFGIPQTCEKTSTRGQE